MIGESTVSIPIWLVVGFLGAGKTTLLRRIARSAAGRRLAFVVNEFSAIDVDAAVIERDGGTVLGVAGGSLFCRCCVSQFADVMRRFTEGIPRPSGDLIFKPDGVVVEASGIADPRSLSRLLSECGLSSDFHVAGVTAVVDPFSLMKLLMVLPNIRGQIESADLILLNKCDVHSQETVEKVEKTISALNPSAKRVRCTRCEVPLPIVLSDSPCERGALLWEAFAACRDSKYVCECFTLRRVLDRERLTQLFSLGTEGLYRIKGVVQTPEGQILVDWSGERLLSLEEIPRSDTRSLLVCIWNPDVSCAAVSELRRLANSEI